jgi:DNA-directed RNA polymerase specialized sigma24 family protein
MPEIEIEGLLRQLAPQVLGAVVRRYGHFDTAEDAMQEALLAAAIQWLADGIPANPRAWLITVASRRLTDLLRSEQARQRRENAVAERTLPEEWLSPAADAPRTDTDDTLILLFMCCHPSLSPPSQIALTLRAVGGLGTAEVPRASRPPAGDGWGSRERTGVLSGSRPAARPTSPGSDISTNVPPLSSDVRHRLSAPTYLMRGAVGRPIFQGVGGDGHRPRFSSRGGEDPRAGSGPGCDRRSAGDARATRQSASAEPGVRALLPDDERVRTRQLRLGPGADLPLLGVSSWALALAIRSQVRTRAARVGLAFLVVAGCGQALAAVFDIRSDIGHNLAGTLGLIGLPVAAVLISHSLGQLRLRVLAHLTWISVVVWMASFVLLIVTMLHVNGSLPAHAPPSLPHGVIGVVGWTNRLLVVVYCAWTAAVAVHSIRLRRDAIR